MVRQKDDRDDEFLPSHAASRELDRGPTIDFPGGADRKRDGVEAPTWNEGVDAQSIQVKVRGVGEVDNRLIVREEG